MIDDSRQNKMTATNDQLTPVQEALAAAYYRLETAKNKVRAQWNTPAIPRPAVHNAKQL